MLRLAAKKNNPWAMDRLACHYICNYLWEKGSAQQKYASKEQLLMGIMEGKASLKMANFEIDDLVRICFPLSEAKKMLTLADSNNYDRSTFHLAVNFYYDTPMYGILLEKASRQGNVQAQEMTLKMVDEAIREWDES